MDSDEFDDDILDEDLIIAATQSHSYSQSQPQPQPQHTGLVTARFRPAPAIGAPVTSFKQTTLFGQTIQANQDSEINGFNSNRAFRADLPPELPTHHELDREAMKTWVYPTNLGATRDYQFSIVKNGLFNNTLVALPTGLGKTFIAATVMLNYYRWMKSAKIIFVAPTKPLVSQQVDACFHIAGISRSQSTLLTGEVSPGLRAEEWGLKRVFFMTPQTLENDLSSGYADPKSIGLLIVDEAHRATGNYSYVKVVSFLRRFTNSVRILALTATPGSKVEAVQEVIDNLGVSHVEIRTEQSIDIRQYVHQRDEEIIALDPSDEMNLVKELYSKALQPLVDKLGQNMHCKPDPMSLTTYGLLKARKDWFARAGQHANQGVKFMTMAVFAVLGSLAHGIKLLNFHGIKPFYDSLVQFRDEAEEEGQKGSKYKRQILEDESFKEMMNRIASWCRMADFVSHPKLTCLSDTVLNHFMDAGEGREGNPSSNTRIIVFSEYRDSAEEIVRILNTHKPLIRAAVFVGQADSKRSGGMKQAEQIERIKRFKSGEFNVLVATSIGEEGLDIGQVDLIVCYDASASPIRMLQRMGRTGRKRAGRVVLLLMRGKEEDNYAKSKDGYEKMQTMICDGSRFNFRHDLSTRIIPRDIRPEVDMRAVEIPVENTQVSGLPEPKKRQPKKKKPAKKFHMPEGVETGFKSVSALLGKSSNSRMPKVPSEVDEVAEIPRLEDVVLDDGRAEELKRMYIHLPGRRAMEFIEQVDVTAHPVVQRMRRKTVHVKHGGYTKRCVRLFQILAKSQSINDRYAKPYGESDSSRYDRLPLPTEGSDSERDEVTTEPPHKKRKAIPISYDDDDDDLEDLLAVMKRPLAKRGPTKKPKAPSERIDIRKDEFLSEDDLIERPALPPQKHAPVPTPKTKKPRPKPSATKRPRGRTKKHSAIYDESADEGDDCRRTSDLDLTDDSDDGSDLVDFVVGDDIATSSNLVSSSMQQARSSSPTSPSTPSVTTSSLPRDQQQKPVAKPYYVPTSFSSTQGSHDDDGEVPSMSQIARDKRASKSSDPSAGDSEGEDGSRVSTGRRKRTMVQGRATKKRRVVLDDDEESE